MAERQERAPVEEDKLFRNDGKDKVFIPNCR
jgi:hypothetical protein